jgi:hypothetical protein
VCEIHSLYMNLSFLCNATVNFVIPFRDYCSPNPKLSIFRVIKCRFIKFEVFRAVTMKNAIFWDVTSCGCCKN